MAATVETMASSINQMASNLNTLTEYISRNNRSSNTHINNSGTSSMSIDGDRNGDGSGNVFFKSYKLNFCNHVIQRVV
jgi:hypothetical protein